MIWEVATVCLIGLFLFWSIISWKSKRELKKLQKQYDESKDQSRPGLPKEVSVE